MGSIGQYAGVKDYIENAYIEDVIMLNAEVGVPDKRFDEHSNTDSERSSP